MEPMPLGLSVSLACKGFVEQQKKKDRKEIVATNSCVCPKNYTIVTKSKEWKSEGERGRESHW